jgi:sulfotransferase family protein
VSASVEHARRTDGAAPRLRWRVRKKVVLGPLHPLFGIGRARPSLLVVGAQRCGTSALASYLRRHPAVFMAWRKEVDYFGMYYDEGERWYLAHFPSRLSVARARASQGVEPAIFEASTGYMPHTAAPRRVASFDPAMKLIALVRDPVERAFSQYRRERSLGREELSFPDALAREQDRIEEARSRFGDSDAFYASPAFLYHSYVLRGRYLEELLRWEEAFPREQLLVVPSEDLFARPAETMARICSFLGLPPSPPAEYPVVNAAPAAELEPEIRERLLAEFSEPNALLYEHLGRDLGWQR